MIDPAAHGLIEPTHAPRPREGPPTISALVTALAAARPNDEVLVGRNGRFSGVELDRAVTKAARAFRELGVEPGDRIAASLPNDVDIVISFLGAMRAGAMWVGINRPLAGPEKRYMLADAEVGVFLGDPEMVQHVHPHRAELPNLNHIVTVDDGPDSWRARIDTTDDDPLGTEVDPLAPAAIAYTSGTTGFPKGAVHTQHNLFLPGYVGARRAVEDSEAGQGVLGVALPLTILNLMVLGPVAAYQTGMRVVAMDRIDPVGMADWISNEHVTTFSAVPAMIHDLLTSDEVDDDQLRSLDTIGVGGADMPSAFRRMYHARFGRHCGTGYGLTEAPTAVTVEDTSQPPVPDTCGRALPQVEVVILDDTGTELAPDEVGEICVRPASVGAFADMYRPMLGYWNRPAATAEALQDGVLHTGDLGCLDADGNLFIKDRRNDLIVRGGANVYPAEVERVLHDDRRVAACAVIGVIDERLGERVAAFVQLTPGSVATEEELREQCEANLARYKVPDTVTFVEGFDRTPMGKVRKTSLRVMATNPDMNQGVNQ